MSYGMCNLPKNGCMLNQKGRGILSSHNNNNLSTVTVGAGIIKTINESVSNVIPSQKDMTELTNKLNNVHIRTNGTKKKKYVNLSV